MNGDAVGTIDLRTRFHCLGVGNYQRMGSGFVPETDSDVYAVNPAGQRDVVDDLQRSLPPALRPPLGCQSPRSAARSGAKELFGSMDEPEDAPCHAWSSPPSRHPAIPAVGFNLNCRLEKVACLVVQLSFKSPAFGEPVTDPDRVGCRARHWKGSAA